MTKLTPAQIKRALNKSFKAFEAIREGKIVLTVMEDASFEATIEWTDKNPSNHELLRREVMKRDFNQLPEVIDFTSKLADAFPQSHIELTLENEQMDLKINGTDALQTSINQFSTHMGPILQEWGDAPAYAYWIDNHGQMPVLPEDEPFQLRNGGYHNNAPATFFKAPNLTAAIRRKALTEAKLGDRKNLDYFSKPQTAAVMVEENPLKALMHAYGNIKPPSAEQSSALSDIFQKPDVGHINDGYSKMFLAQDGKVHRVSQNAINMHPDDLAKRNAAHTAWMDDITVKIKQVFELYPNAAIVAEATIDRGVGTVSLRVDHHTVSDVYNAHIALELIETIAPKKLPMRPFFFYADDKQYYSRRSNEYRMVCARSAEQALHMADHTRGPVGPLGQNPTKFIKETKVYSCLPLTREDIHDAWLKTQG